MRRFSDRFPTFFDWRLQAENSNYAKQIQRLHYFYPNATLSQLSGRDRLPSKKLSIHVVDPRGLKPKERVNRVNSLSVLNKIRRGENPRTVIDDSDLSDSTLKTYLKNNIRFLKNSIKISKVDKIPREMIIKEDGNEIPIITKNSKNASIIGQYHNAVRYFLDTGDNSKLKKFKKTRIKDVDGTTHSLETNSDKIIEIEDRKEEPEIFEIYKT